MKHYTYNLVTSIVTSLLVTAGCIAAAVVSFGNGNTMMGVLLLLCLLIPVIFSWEMVNKVVIIEDGKLRFNRTVPLTLDLADIKEITIQSMGVSGLPVFLVTKKNGENIAIKAGFSASVRKCEQICDAVKAELENNKKDI